ncbi:MAG: hypothetical protein SGJ17_11060 [Hyphomicrobiales bacterium]|nr:hypothetical protein [Hyphomicrobiales bacterium]
MLNNKQPRFAADLNKEAETKSTGDIVHVRFHQQELIEAEQAAQYLSEMLSDMRVIAAKSGFKFLAALIEVASEEARLQIGKKHEFADIA